MWGNNSDPPLYTLFTLPFSCRVGPWQTLEAVKVHDCHNSKMQAIMLLSKDENIPWLGCIFCLADSIAMINVKLNVKHYADRYADPYKYYAAVWALRSHLSSSVREATLLRSPVLLQ
mgnify:CR=1 FL=1